jgi:hypothetical protein
MKTVNVECIESGTFVGGEEETYDAGIEVGDVCVVMRKEDYKSLKTTANNYKKLKKILFEDESGDLEFVKSAARKLEG